MQTIKSRLTGKLLASAVFACITPLFGYATEPRISVGGDHMLLLKADGTLWSWGRNPWGQLGLNNTDTKNVPTQIPGATGFIDVVARETYSLGLKADGTVWAWGDNSDGRIGPYNNRAKIPVQVTGLSSIQAIDASWGYTSYAIGFDGKLWAWGDDDYGQLGSGRANVGNFPIPTPIGLANIKQVASSSSHTLALSSNGVVMGWGDNRYGVLGVSTVGNVVAPGLVNGLQDVKAIADVDINIEGGHFALRKDGSVWSWGDSNFIDCGQKRKQASDYNIPTKINNLAPVKHISGGVDHVLFVTDAGSVAGCGVNSDGQLGDGTRNDTESGDGHVGPRFANGLVDITWAAAGHKTSAAISANGSVYTWGQTAYGVSGTGSDSSTTINNLTAVKLNINAGQAATYPAVYAGTQSAQLGNTTLDVGFAPAAAHVGANGRIYLALLSPNGQLLFLNANGNWMPFSANSVAYMYEGKLPRSLPIHAGAGDYSKLNGVTIFMGYGVGSGSQADNDMLQKMRYAAVLTLSNKGK